MRGHRLFLTGLLLLTASHGALAETKASSSHKANIKQTPSSKDALSSYTVDKPDYTAKSVIQKIVVSGTNRLDADTVKSYIALHEGDSYSIQKIDRSLKALYGIGLFSDVKITPQGSTLYLDVKENPIVNHIGFEGNSRYDDEALKKEILLKPRAVYTKAKIQADTQRLMDLYRKAGRYSTTVTHKLVELDQNRLDVVFQVGEGDVNYIEKIKFMGNEAFSESNLRDQIDMREDRWWRFLSSSTTYDEDHMAVDKERLRQFYLSKGYADFQVISAVSELTEDKKGFEITYTIKEGNRYNINHVTVDSKLSGLNAKDLKDDLLVNDGDSFNMSLIQKSIDAMVIHAGRLGFPFVEIIPNIQKDAEGKKIDITLQVVEGRPVYVERIDIEGNVRTLDKVIRREFTLAEGDAFNRARLERSKRNLRGLGFFENVEILEQAGSTPDRVVLKVKVKEMSTGDITFGVGYSTTDSVLGQVSLTERNLLGTGQYVRASGALSGRRQEVDLSYTDPYFLDKQVAAGVDLFHVTNNYQDEASYDERNTGFGLHLGFDLGEFLKIKPYYRFSIDEISNIAPDASAIVRDAEGKYSSSAIGYDLVYDRRDDIIQPTSGYLLSYKQDLIGLGGDVKALKSRMNGVYFYTPFEQYTFSFNIEGAVMGTFGGYKPRILDRYLIGGNTFRGFQVAGIGPRALATSKTNDDALGGNYYLVSRNELSFPLSGLDELGISGALFSDVGSLWGVNNISSSLGNYHDDMGLRASAGVGIKWASPMGPIRLDFAQPFVKKSYDKTEIFRFSAGSQF
jgi:outer membrane protein insertion porin family